MDVKTLYVILFVFQATLAIHADTQHLYNALHRCCVPTSIGHSAEMLREDKKNIVAVKSL